VSNGVQSKELVTKLNLLDAAISDLNNIACTFCACPGPDRPYKPMATCNKCQVVFDLRKLRELVSKETVDDPTLN